MSALTAARKLPATVAPTAPPAGYTADKLDDTLGTYLAVANRTIRHAEALGKRVEDALANLEAAGLTGGASALDEANTITVLYDRMTKAGLQLTKALDELTRLRSFLAGGPDSRPDLTVKGEIELRALVLTAVKTLGLKVVEA